MPVLRVRLLGVVTSRSETRGLLHDPGDAVVVERGRPRVLLLMCPSGCGEELAIPLDKSAGPAWRLYRNRGSLTLYPSVWRDTGCECHFVIWKDRIYLFDKGVDDSDQVDEADAGDLQVQNSEILGQLSDRELQSYVAIADRLDVLPWDVLFACRDLVRRGDAIEGTGNLRGHFRRGGVGDPRS